MNQYERRFYEDIHKLVLIQKDILKELKNMNEPLQEDKERNEMQQRIDKAIEFICKKDMEANLTGESVFNSNELIEILKGE